MSADSESRRSVLIVDDDEVDRYLVHHLVGDAFVLIEAASLRAARERLNEGVDVVLLDDRLAGENGGELLPLLGSRGIPAIMLTGNEDPDWARGLLESGARSILSKNGLTHEALSSALAGVLGEGVG